MLITSLQNPMVKHAAALQQKKYRDETGLFLAEGETPCRDAIARNWECVTLFTSGEDIKAPCEITHVTPEILAKISKKDNPQKVVGIFRQRFTVPQKANFLLALEEIRDPGNLGTIMRTAHAVGVAQIVLVGPCCDAFSPEVIRASMGSFSAIQLASMSMLEFIHWQTENGLALLGTDVNDAVDYRKVDYTNAILVMGNEQKGLSAALKARCTTRVHIPMPGGTESLNLAVATGLLLYQVDSLKS